MSYCRWSCDGFKSDVYVYESDAGYEIHVKGGESYCEGSPKDAIAALLELRGRGFHVPQHALDSLTEELEDKYETLSIRH